MSGIVRLQILTNIETQFDICHEKPPLLTISILDSILQAAPRKTIAWLQKRLPKGYNLYNGAGFFECGG